LTGKTKEPETAPKSNPEREVIMGKRRKNQEITLLKDCTNLTPVV